jgi:biotin-(acetyl-CoA carboxylase) ligase
MEEERHAPDPTRKLLRAFGVQVTNYEERTAEILDRLRSGDAGVEERLRLAAEAADLTGKMSSRLQEMTGHVLEHEKRVLSELRGLLDDGARRRTIRVVEP